MTDTETKEISESPQKIVDAVTRLNNHQQQQVIAKLDMYAGPIPHPDILARYDKLDPGAAKKIIDNGVEESVHRRALEDRGMEYTRADIKRRDWMGFAIGVLGILFGALLIYKNHPIVGSVFSGSSLVVLVGMFLGDTKSETQDEKKHVKDKEEE